MFCIKCGNPAFHGNFCEKCYLDKKELFELKQVKLRYCDNCKLFYTQKQKMDETKLKEYLAGRITPKHRIKDTEISGKIEPGNINCIITAKGCIAPSKILVSDTKKIAIRPRIMKCNNCVKILGNYHEAVIQIRGEQKEKILKKTERVLKKSDIANLVILKEGYDIRVINKSTANTAIAFLKDRFSVKRSFKLVGEKKGRKIYRNFYAVR